ncbi:hypothetical protein HSX11_08600 [Oxalobacteraceae bacterium]|nr:hypothetical protein [Oxalobacteraceae bacterium]
MPDMLTIRRSQLRAMGCFAHTQYVDAMVAHLYDYFPALAWPLTRSEVGGLVHAAIEHAAAYGLTTQQQVCRFINLGAAYGWQFDSDPNLPWMRAILTDTSLAQPAERLDRLIQTCLYRQRIEAHNRALRQLLGLESAVASDVSETSSPTEYCGLDSYGNTVPGLASFDEALMRNRLRSDLSFSLWHSVEAAFTPRASGETPPWTGETAALLRAIPGASHADDN